MVGGAPCGVYRPERKYLILFYMKTIWVILSLLFGILFFALGCLVDAVAVEAFGAAFIFVGLIGLFGKIWPEEVEGK